MTSQIKSLILLAATLVAGFALGLFADASLVRGRRERIADMRRPPGLVAHLEDVIQPHSTAQGDSIRPLLEQLARGNDAIISDANARLKARMDSIVITLSPMLDAGQRDRLTREMRRIPPMGPGRGGPPPGGRGSPPPDGPPGDRPPPPRDR